jgi:hypothetical protein
MDKMHFDEPDIQNADDGAEIVDENQKNVVQM